MSSLRDRIKARLAQSHQKMTQDIKESWQWALRGSYEAYPKDIVTIGSHDLEWLPQELPGRGYKDALEIGCAYGSSSLAIAKSISGHLTIVDPVQSAFWQRAGIQVLESNGYANFTLMEDGSEFVLPFLLADRRKYDVIFIDGFHSYGQVSMELYFADRLLATGGALILDDYHAFTGVRLAIDSYLARGSSNNFEMVDHGRLVELIKRSDSNYFES